MARYIVLCDTCGKDMDFNTWGGNSRDRQWRADHFSHECNECKQNRLTIENKKNVEKNKEEGLPPLLGSEKQIAWAETIRAKILSNVNDFIKKAEVVYKELSNNQDITKRVVMKIMMNEDFNLHNRDCLMENDIESINFKITKLFENTLSSFWIDNRGKELYEFLENIEDEKVEVQKNLEKQLQKEAELEATIRPKEPITETIATISLIDNKKISISFPEKNEEFRLLVKDFGYSWSGSSWDRDILYRNGSVEDRVVNIGNTLLENGFIIRIFDEELRQRAINGVYEPEHTRWIQDYKGKFSIRWKKHFENFYREAKKIPTAIWDNPTVDVRAEQFEAVEDFANEYNFKFTPKAKELLDKAKETKQSQLIPTLIKGESPKKAIEQERDFSVKEGEIDETLLD